MRSEERRRRSIREGPARGPESRAICRRLSAVPPVCRYRRGPSLSPPPGRDEIHRTRTQSSIHRAQRRGLVDSQLVVLVRAIESPQDAQCHEQEDSRTTGQEITTESNREANGRSRPDRGCGRQSYYACSILREQHDARAEETDAHRHSLNQLKWLDAQRG